jgi:hypothetical protein
MAAQVGKNRPLEADELQFLDAVAEAEAQREREWELRQQEELEAFKAVSRACARELVCAPPSAAMWRRRAC